MTNEKEKLLNDTLEKAIKIGFGLVPADDIEDVFTQNVMVIGTAVEEKYTSLEGLRELIRMQQEQSQGMELKFTRNEVYRHYPDGDNVAVIVEDIYLEIKIDTDTTGFDMRASTIFECKNEQWKMIHWHASKPDNVQSATDTYGIEEWKQKADALEKLVAERTADLVGKNRELEIETSLERVRAVALSMHKSDDLLLVSQSLLAELKLLGFREIRNAIINTFNDEKSFFLDYDYSELLGGHITTIPYNRHPLIEKHLQQVRKSTDAFAETIVAEQELQSWIEGRRANGEPEDPRLQNIPALHYYFYSTGPAAIGLSTYSALTDDKRELLKRFRNVFELAYRRYVDIEKAEAQAREAQIELALERVRARTMAMQQSSELADTASVLFQQIKELGFQTWSCGFCTWQKGDMVEVWMGADSGGLLPPMLIPYKEEPTHQKIYEALIAGHPALYQVWEGAELDKHYVFLKTIPTVKAAIDILEKSGLTLPKRQCYYVGFFEQGYLLIITEDTNAELENLSKRFANIFAQAYTRFLDLQKAEAQAREAKIEAALEKVRSRSLAMHKSDELPDAANLLFQQVQSLGMTAWSAGYCLWNDDKSAVTLFMSSEGVLQPPFTAPTTEDALFIEMRQGQEGGKTFHVVEMGDEKLVKHYEYMRTLPVVGKILDSIIAAGHPLPTFQIMHHAYFPQGFLLFITYESAPDAHDIFKRFGNVFEQTYTRFLDLQKAEAQAKEAQIETALERVRSRTMGMQKSEELKEIIKVVYEQLATLNINVEHAGFIIDYKERNDMLIWLADKHAVPSQITISYFDSPHWNSFIDAKEKGKDFFANHLSFEEKNKFYQDLFTLFPVPDNDKEYYFTCSGLAISTVLLDSVGLYIENFAGTPYSSEENTVLVRFGKVFQQSYTRFLDLQKAEAQSRESQIQLALERVRARTLAMQHSEELSETASVLFEQFNALGEAPERIAIEIVNEAENLFEIWATEHGGLQLNLLLKASLDEPHVMQKMYRAWKDGTKTITIDLQGTELEEYFQFLNKAGLPVKREIFGKRRVQNVATFSKGILTIITSEPRPQETIDILERFAGVFDGTYIRFLDLQKAEAQAREAQIELSLERVRARTMAMHNSIEVGDTAAVMENELKNLGIQTMRFGIGIFHEPGNMELWTISMDEKNKTNIIIGWMDMHIHPLLQGAFNSWRAKNESYSYELQEDDLLTYFNAINNYPGYPVKYDISSLPRQIHHNEFTFTEGILFSFSVEQLTDEQRRIFKRFAAAFGQTYRRYLDLKNAEAQTREAQIEASLERVRSRTLAMQKSDELSETAAELFKQLIGLGIEPNRLYIGIVNADTKDMEMWATDEDGTRVSKKFSFNAGDNDSVKKLYDGWLTKEKSVVVDMEGVELENYISYLQQLKLPLSHALTQKRRVQSVAYFDKGFIGMASPDKQPEATILLLERFAAVFNLTFTRFNDLKIAEAHAEQAELDLIKLKEEKGRTEQALNELQLTQKQLIQSEKMASLGELTAGIAHEIQNPLNFVNNFSEVSKELLDEMKTALDGGDEEEAKAIAADIIQNLEKINHHGKRADAIVKGMLQHSRSSSNQKEPTDINALADEYLRLAYHGLRAKEKSFNATLETDFDSTIEKIEIIPQDIGRVILNLITNAFYAVNEKAKKVKDGFQPAVWVSTKRKGDTIVISVRDNGNGIPQNIISKIFQPFFTTKPTGQGTGLGLSLAYDIVKAHGGELKVETKQGAGTDFIIQLPFN